MSIDYLIRLEQGRDLDPSPGVLKALASALRLSEEERQHLARLAMATRSPDLCPLADGVTDRVRPTLRLLVQQLNPMPAFVLDPLASVLAWNDAWASVGSGLGMLDGDPPNLNRHLFLSPLSRQVLPDWEQIASRETARLREAEIRWGRDPKFQALVEDLSASPEFAERWEAHVTRRGPLGILRCDHPEAGTLLMHPEALRADADDQRLATWLPADEDTDSALRALATGPLRVVRRA